MATLGSARPLALLLALSALGGCVSVPGKEGVTVKAVDGAYVAPAGSSIPTDIKQILAQGGLNANDPSAPSVATKATEVAAAGASAQSVERLVAKLRSDPPGTASVVTAGAEPPAGAMSLVQDPASNPAMVAMAPSSAPSPESSTFVYPEIGSPPEAKPMVAAAMAPSSKPHRRAATEGSVPSPKRTRRF